MLRTACALFTIPGQFSVNFVPYERRATFRLRGVEVSGLVRSEPETKTMNTITITPALNAALLAVREADVALCNAPRPRHGERGCMAADYRRTYKEAEERLEGALGELCVILNPRGHA